MILTHLVDVNETLKLTLGQSHGVKGLGQIFSYRKNTLSIKHEPNVDIYESYIHNYIDKKKKWQRSRLRDQRSR